MNKIFSFFISELTPINSKIKINASHTDIYKRTLAQILNSDGLNVNIEMIKVGLAALYPYQKGNKKSSFFFHFTCENLIKIFKL